jgi:hypothetical protein
MGYDRFDCIPIISANPHTRDNHWASFIHSDVGRPSIIVSVPFVVFTKHTVLYNAFYPVTHHPSIASPDNKYHVLKVGAMLRDLAAFANPTLLYMNL